MRPDTGRILISGCYDDMRVNFKTVNYFYLGTLFLMLLFGGIIQEKLQYTGYVITEFGLILFPVFIYVIINDLNVKHIFKLNKLTAKDILMACVIALFLWILSESISVVWVFLIQNIITIASLPMTPPDNTLVLFLQIVVIAIIPAICEELYFRGFLLTGYMEFGYKKAVFISGLLFGLMHLNMATIPSMIVLGMALAYTVYKTDSIFASMIIHFINNTISILILSYSKSSGMQNGSINATSMILWLALGILSLFALKHLFDNLGKSQYETIDGVDNVKFIKTALLHWPIVLSFSIIMIYLMITNLFGYLNIL